MASKNIMIGTGAALAGVGGLAIAAVTANHEPEKAHVRTIAQPVETRTVIIRKVERHVKRVPAPRHPTPSPSSAGAAAPVAAQPVAVQQAPVVATRPVSTAAPIRTRTSGAASKPAPIRTRTSAGTGGGGGHDDAAEHGDD